MALTALQLSDDESHALAYSALRVTVRTAKRNYYEHRLQSADPVALWSAIRITKGHSNVFIPALQSPTGPTQDPVRQAEILHAQFHPSSHPHVEINQPDDPPPLPTRQLEPITEAEVLRALTPTSNSSAPGPSGIGYKLLKWAFEAAPLRLVDLFNACLHLGYHPWHTGTVIILPKLGKPDYSVAKAYRPITLLECCGKLLEKIVASHILHDNLVHQLIPSSQFGSRNYSCAVDAATCLTHNISDTLKSRNAGALILFNIQGFFDNIHPG